MKVLNCVDGYNLEDVAQEVANLYGAEMVDWEVTDGKLVVHCDECGEDFDSYLELTEIKSFMEM